MRPQTFPNFLTQYVKTLSKNPTLSLFKLEQEVQKNTRLLEVFGLYCLFDTQKTKTLVKHSTSLNVLYRHYLDTHKRYQGLDLNNLNQEFSKLNQFDPLRKAYESYLAQGFYAAERRKAFFRQKIIEHQKNHTISSYRIYTDLHLNHGNTHDFLKNNHLDKLSLDNVKRIYAYCQNYSQS